MKVDARIGQFFAIGLQGLELTSEEAEFIVANNIGGVTLFGRNIDTPQQVHELCLQLFALRNRLPDRLPLFIAIDMEGGRVHRLKTPYTQWPSLRKVGELGSASMAFKFAQAMGSELRATGINLNFAPCVDVLSDAGNQVIGDRSLGSDSEEVAKMASALVRGYVKSGILVSPKHFPGHGATTVDSHEDLPVIEADMETINRRDLEPFKKAIRARADLIMTAHILYPNLDSEWPATLSEKILGGILRDEMRFRGLIVSDDLDMRALANKYSRAEIPVQALKAGCDILLYCNEPDSPPVAIEAVRKAAADGTLSEELIAEHYDRIARLKKSRLLDSGPFSKEEFARVVGHPEHLKIARAINEGTMLED